VSECPRSHTRKPPSARKQDVQLCSSTAPAATTGRIQRMLHNAAADSSYSHSNRDSRFFRWAIICATGISMWLERTWHWSIGGVSLAWLPEQPERSQYLDSVAECVERITRCAPVPDFLSGSAGSLREKSATSSTCVSRAKWPGIPGRTRGESERRSRHARSGGRVQDIRARACPASPQYSTKTAPLGQFQPISSIDR
jgi:hypothetical protein